MPGDLTLSWFAHFCYTQLFVSVPLPHSSYAGKAVIVTGANSGIGFEAARWFARLQVSKLILAVRSPSKGEAAKASILASTTSPDTTIEVWELDLASHESVRSFAKRTQKLERIDVLLCNAAVATQRWQVAEVNELCITVNVISTMLLAFLLLPKLKATATQFNTRPHLTFVSSPGHYFVDFKEKDDPAGIFAGLRNEKKADMVKRYSTSKLLAVYIVREMAARRPADTYPVTINMVDPGLCWSELNREPDLGTSILKILLARTAEVGARALLGAAEAGEETHGIFLSGGREREPATVVVGEEGMLVQGRVWSELMGILEGIEEGVVANL